MNDTAAAARGMTAAFLAVSAGALFTCAAWTLRFDPLWVWREAPPWLVESGGQNRILDVEIRRAKALQILTRAPETAVAGSSAVYRGIDPAPLGAGAFNAGFSSLMAEELPALAKLLIARKTPRRVIIGLDYFMFTDFPVPVRLQDSWSRPDGAIKLAAWSLLSFSAVTSSTAGFTKGPAEPLGWTGQGFRATPDRPPALTQRIRQEQTARTLLPYRAAKTAMLREALGILGSGERIMFLSPVNGDQRRAISEKGLDADFARWRADAAAASRAAGAAFHDLTDAAAELDDFDPAKGSSRHWFDSLHYRPSIGALILKRIGAV